MEPVRVVLDACVLYDAAVRDLLLRLGAAGLIEPIWSDRILDECFGALARNRPDIGENQRGRLRSAIHRAFPDAAVVAGPASVDLPDPDDAHVVGTALAARASTVVTYNLGDFPNDELAKVGLVAQHPQDAMLTILDAEPRVVADLVVAQAAALRRPPSSTDRLLGVFADRGLPNFAARVRAILDR